MEFLPLLLVMCLTCSVWTCKCLPPMPMDHFSLANFSGIWYHSTLNPMDPADKTTYRNARCGRNIFYLNEGVKGVNNWILDMYLGEAKSNLKGTYYSPDLQKGLVKLYNQPGNFTYDLSVLCTDYSNWSILYACAEVEPDYTSEFIAIMLRDLKTFNEVISKDSVQKCLKRLTPIPANKLNKVPFTNCSADFFTNQYNN